MPLPSAYTTGRSQLPCWTTMVAATTASSVPHSTQVSRFCVTCPLRICLQSGKYVRMAIALPAKIRTFIPPLLNCEIAEELYAKHNNTTFLWYYQMMLRIVDEIGNYFLT